MEKHKHCRNCDKAIAEDKVYCDDECKQARVATLRAQRNRLLMMVLFGAVVILVTTVLPFLGR